MTVYQADAKQTDGAPPPRMRKQNKYILRQGTLCKKLKTSLNDRVSDSETYSGVERRAV